MKYLKSIIIKKLKPLISAIIPALALVFSSIAVYAQSGSLIPTGSDQQNFTASYKMALEASDDHYRSTSSEMDSMLFPKFGEFSVYRILEGDKKGSFVFPDVMPQKYETLASSTYQDYEWKNINHLSVQFKREPNTIAIFKSNMKVDDHSASWEATYFKDLFETYLFGDIYTYINENDLLESEISDSTQLLIIPSFSVKDDDPAFYFDQLFDAAPHLKTRLNNFLSGGGQIYTEGNGFYFLVKLGIIPSGTVDFSHSIDLAGNELLSLNVDAPNHPVALAGEPTSNKIYASSIPIISDPGISTIVSATTDNRPVIFSAEGEKALGGKIVCCLGLPTTQGLAELDEGSRQLNWTLDAIFGAFAKKVDVTRSIRNNLPPAITAGKNAVSFDGIDTFEVNILLRNLQKQPVENIHVQEYINAYFTFGELLSGDSYTVNENKLDIQIASLAPFEEKTMTYTLVTPQPEDPVHEDIDDFLAKDNLIVVSENTTTYDDGGTTARFVKDKNYADIMFGARLFADADVNWKNFLGLEYQPFKVFMNLENKSRTAAMNAVYTQFVPKDVPFYWSDQSINIPVLKTPGGKYVDILKGSNDEANPDFDMDSDGHPDVWLDTASIFPKGYTLEEDEVYWVNPWSHLRGADSVIFEDIDHDGMVARDLDGDGVVDVEEPGDKIRVWKITWNMEEIAGYEYYEPFCYYEMWIDPPDLVKLAAGVGYAHDSLASAVDGMFYPYTEDIESADISDTTWTHWMERDKYGHIDWKQFIYQRMNNYEGFTFIDTAEQHYALTPYDSCAGTVPQPHREFLAVVSMGGEETDMYHPTPSQSMYSNLDYSTIFNEERTTPIRTTYTYYAPLPNPLQFEYLANTFEIRDTVGNTIDHLPEWGEAELVFNIKASTEYTYYWIRNMGHDVDYKDPSELLDGDESMGDGVFGYFMYEIPRGMGGYKITLPKLSDGSYDVNSIVQIDGQDFTKWLDNPNTGAEIEIWENPYSYQVYVPQILIPPALDDDNNDGTDDWIDDRGDRFSSKTGFLHDHFMTDDGEDWRDYPASPFKDDIYGWVDSGWYAGADGTYGDDFFEKQGITNIEIRASYEGKGREGSIEISKGGILVVEEIFGGSPWVIFSHVLSGNAQGIDFKLTSEASPSVVKFGADTICIKHTIEDENEPHEFDINFDPYHMSAGYGEAAITTFLGAKDPCSLLEPAIAMPAVIDFDHDHQSITLIPNADPENPDLSGYPRNVNGTFAEVRIEVINGTDDNWINTAITPVLPDNLGSTKVEMSYVAYPRPLVPGDDLGTFEAGWRFNQPEGEVLVKMGNTLNLLQPSRKAYFIVLLNIDETLENGIYQIDFEISGEKQSYDGTTKGDIEYTVPSAMFSVTEKSANGSVIEYQDIVLDAGFLKELSTQFTSIFTPIDEVKWSLSDINHLNYDTITQSLPSDNKGSVSAINLSGIGSFPKQDTSTIYILQKGIVKAESTDEFIQITEGSELLFAYDTTDNMFITADPLYVEPIGPNVEISHQLFSVNGVEVKDTLIYEPDKDIFIVTLLKVKNTGSDISDNTVIDVHIGNAYIPLLDSMPGYITLEDDLLHLSLGHIEPGNLKKVYLHFKLEVENMDEEDFMTLIPMSDIEYIGLKIKSFHQYTDPSKLLFPVYDFKLDDLGYADAEDQTVTVSATAINRGKDATDVWFRIYPIIGEGIYEFPFAEVKIDSFKQGEEYFLASTYQLPKTSKKIEFIAIIDDGEAFPEILEENNKMKIEYTGTVEINDLAKNEIMVTTSPNPFTGSISFNYRFIKELEKLDLVVFDALGNEVKIFHDCPVEKGFNKIMWHAKGLPAGNYWYKFNGRSAGNAEFICTGSIVKQ